MVVVSDVAVSIGIKEDFHSVIVAKVRCDVQSSDGLTPFATENCMVHVVWVNSFLHHIVEDPWILLSCRKDQRACKLLGGPVLDVRDTELCNLGIIAQLLLQNGAELLQVVLTDGIEDLCAIVLDDGADSHPVDTTT